VTSLTDDKRSLSSVPAFEGVGALHASARRTGSDVVVTVSGEIDIATVDRIRSAVAESLREPLPASLTIDLSGVTFCDCCGIEALEWAHGRALRAQARFSLVGASTRLRRTFALARAGDLLDACSLSL
jgi:anti-anti-sigma factor